MPGKTIDTKMPVRFYRGSNGSNSARVNSAIDEYNEISGTGTEAEREEALTKIEFLLEGMPVAPKKKKAANAISKAVSEEEDEVLDLGDSVENPVGPQILAGPKAGFELEWSDVLILDRRKMANNALAERMLKASDAHARLRRNADALGLDADKVAATKKALVDKAKDARNRSKKTVYSEEGTPKSVETLFKDAGYAKRTVLFDSPNGTWQGTADSTLTRGSNLEVVTKPLTPDQWDEAEGAAEKDAEALKQFVASLQNAPAGVLVQPREVMATLQIRDPNAVLLHDGAAQPQVQMTRAERLATDEEAPAWWIAGLHWKAFPVLRKIASSLENDSFLGSNPKSAFNGIIPKTPLLNVLGRPAETVTLEEKTLWVTAVAKACHVELGNTVAKPLVDKSRGSMKLEETGFTYRQWFEALLAGRDPVQVWAKTAFGGAEDVGLGQIDDATLDADWMIEEHRNDQSITYANYLEKARSWSGRVRD